MKSAKELFEELGYDYGKSEGLIVCKYEGTYDTITISFDLFNKCYECSWKENGYITTMFINMLLHKAINKQIEELGWK